MKKIYTFTLKGDDYPSVRFDSNLRLFAYMLYHTIYDFYDEDHIAVNINKNIVYNELHENPLEKSYYFDSDLYDDGFINYEPFIISQNTFAITINDDVMEEKTIRGQVNYVNRLLKFNYDIIINSFNYISKNKDDESNRYKTINLATNKLGFKFRKKRSLLKCLIPSFKRKII